MSGTRPTESPVASTSTPQTESVFTTIALAPFRAIAYPFQAVSSWWSVQKSVADQIKDDVTVLESGIKEDMVKLNSFITMADKKDENFEVICTTSIGIADKLDKALQTIQDQIAQARDWSVEVRTVVQGVVIEKLLHLPNLMADKVKDSVDRKLSLTIHNDIMKTERVVNDVVANLDVAQRHVNPLIGENKSQEKSTTPNEGTPIEQIQVELENFRMTLKDLKAFFNKRKTELQVKDGKIKPIEGSQTAIVSSLQQANSAEMKKEVKANEPSLQTSAPAVSRKPGNIKLPPLDVHFSKALGRKVVPQASVPQKGDLVRPRFSRSP